MITAFCRRLLKPSRVRLLLLSYSRLLRWLKSLRRDFRQNKLLPSLALEDSYGLMGLTILLLSMAASGTPHPTETTSPHGMPEWLLSKPTRISVWVSKDTSTMLLPLAEIPSSSLTMWEIPPDLSNPPSKPSLSSEHALQD